VLLSWPWLEASEPDARSVPDHVPRGPASRADFIGAYGTFLRCQPGATQLREQPSPYLLRNPRVGSPDFAVDSTPLCPGLLAKCACPPETAEAGRRLSAQRRRRNNVTHHSTHPIGAEGTFGSLGQEALPQAGIYLGFTGCSTFDRYALETAPDRDRFCC